MKFSLKDLMWSLSLASLGLASVGIGLNLTQFAFLNLLAWIVFVVPGAMFGAAIGRLCQRAYQFGAVGAVVWFVFGLVLLHHLGAD